MSALSFYKTNFSTFWKVSDLTDPTFFFLDPADFTEYLFYPSLEFSSGPWFSKDTFVKSRVFPSTLQWIVFAFLIFSSWLVRGPMLSGQDNWFLPSYFSSIGFPPTSACNHMSIFLVGSTGYIYLGSLLHVFDFPTKLVVHSRFHLRLPVIIFLAGNFQFLFFY